MIRRSKELVFVGYFLSRCGDQKKRPGLVLPPQVLGTDEWKKAYAIFYRELREGRSLRSYSNTLKNSRDAFDAWLDSGRVGWRTNDKSKEPRKLGTTEQSVFDQWAHQGEHELWEQARRFADLSVNSISGSVLADLEAELEPDEEIRARTEGGRKVIISTRVERDPSLRSAAIRLHGTQCVVCKFGFGQVYGEWGEGFIEVHHIVPLGDDDETRNTNPETDLVVLCSNCHRMVHRRRKEVLDVEELRMKLNVDAIRLWAASLVSG